MKFCYIQNLLLTTHPYHRESLIRGINIEEADSSNEVKLQKKHVEEAIEEISPSGLKDLILEIPKVYWSEIGGYSQTKEEIR